ncbi:NAD(P)H-dependent oxidoreductase [Flavobacterium sp. MFBS3-15]|uniref:FMN-dependent NADH-azoreductase n=1 Tax=Flavobacterium sp. MFBS3-15 TaxID=2989816 RepID=UPI0022357431|nr:NAD(P)H-dependent oxidoreductase [Flavobacterium sp. MFBS3-15]MCW4470623.1 NAD(P)H-dependent oxidoreductase [Flavobacterium sp. MFBS3-15]
MKNILHVISSPSGENSISIKLGNAIVEKLVAEYPGSSVIEINVAKDPFPHLEENLIKATRSSAAPSDDEALVRSNKAVQQIKDADIIVIGVPLFNFSIPSTLKAWLDNVVRPGVAFTYSENGVQGLITGKQVYLAVASGAIYSEGPMKDFDFAAPYLEKVFNFIGVTDITTVRAEGVNMPNLKDIALQKAIDSIAV